MDEFDFVCISLVHRTDRQKRSRKLFQELGILDRMNWWIVKKHPQGGMYGCFESHWQIWNSEKFKRPYLCIFEDDLKMNPDAVRRFHQCLEYARRAIPEKIDILNLEPSLGFLEEHLEGDIYKGGFLHLGAYILHRSVRSQISTRTIGWFGMDIDTALYKNCRMGGVFPQVFRQYGEDTDNDGGYRNVNIQLYDIWEKVATVYEKAPLLGWLGMEFAQLLSWYYLFIKGEKLEFKDRRIGRFKKKLWCD